MEQTETAAGTTKAKRQVSTLRYSDQVFQLEFLIRFVRKAKAGMESIQNYILRGKRAEAVEVALESNNFALALLVSTFCDAQTYHHVVKQYADKVLRGGSPLHTTAMLFSGQLDATVWSENPKELLGSWRHHLAALISNRINGWDRVVVALGCKLQEMGDTHAAHVCFMVSGLQLMSPITPESYMSLLGCDHHLPENVSLMTQEGIEAYERTEAYEWAKRKGNPTALIRALQPFKLKYAMLLADFGYVELAKSYLENILIMVELDGDDTRFENNVAARLTLPEMCESPEAFKAALASFEQRLFQNVTGFSDSEKDAQAQSAAGSSPAKEDVFRRDDLLSPPHGDSNLQTEQEYPGLSQAPTAESEVSFMTATSHMPDHSIMDPTSQTKTKDKVKIARVIRNPKKDTILEDSTVDTFDEKGRNPTTPLAGTGDPVKLAAPKSGPPTTTPGSAPTSQMATSPAEKPKTEAGKPTNKPKPSVKKPEPAPKSAPAVMSQSKFCPPPLLLR
jgi:Sec23-binding domain of Sec16